MRMLLDQRVYGDRKLINHERINQHQSVTASFTFDTNLHSGVIFNNRGAAGAVTITLPAPTAALAGTRVGASRIAAQNVVVNGGAAASIRTAAGTGITLTCSANFGMLVLECDGTEWRDVTNLGTWALA